MYSFLEIEIIFKNCSSAEELKQIRKAFAMVFEDKDLSNQKLFFIRKQQRLRSRELEKLKTNIMAKKKLYPFESEELAASFLKIESENSEEIEQALADKHDISMEVFHEICSHLFSMIDLGVSPLTNTPLVGFGTGKHWLAKKEITSQFIGSVIQWTSEGETFKEGKGFSRDITCEGKKEFEITIKKYPLKTKTDEK